MEVYLAWMNNVDVRVVVGVFDDLEAAKLACDEWAARRYDALETEWEVGHIQPGGDGVEYEKRFAPFVNGRVANFTLNDAEEW